MRTRPLSTRNIASPESPLLKSRAPAGADRDSIRDWSCPAAASSSAANIGTERSASRLIGPCGSDMASPHGPRRGRRQKNGTVPLLDAHGLQGVGGRERLVL